MIKEGYSLVDSLSIPSQIESIPIVETLIDDVCKKIGVHEDVYGNVLIAVTEAVNNAIYHISGMSIIEPVEHKIKRNESCQCNAAGDRKRLTSRSSLVIRHTRQGKVAPMMITRMLSTRIWMSESVARM